MKIDGKALADKILNDLSLSVVKLKEKGATPTLAVIQVGDDPASTAYIRQKQKASDEIGAILIHKKLPKNTSFQSINETIQQCNNDSSIHGIIVQRPLPGTLSDAGAAVTNIVPSKDVDGFLPNSPYPVPVAAAVITILKQLTGSRPVKKQGETPSIVVLGKGDTAGKPIAEALIKRGYNISIVHSQTPKPDDIIRAADIVISCVGKPNVVRHDNIKTGAILLSVGISRNSDGTLSGDYEEEGIKDVASFFTPTPGGVGPVNVACLMANLVEAASNLL